MEQGDVVPSSLTLCPPFETTKVVNPTDAQRCYKQDLRYDGRRLVLRTGPIDIASVVEPANAFGSCMKIPVSPWLRRQLDIVEEYVTSTISLPPTMVWQARDDKDTPYKKIWDGQSLIIGVSNWCKYFQQEDYLKEITRSDIGAGTVDICITMCGVYFGPHKENKLASITMRIQHVLYKPSLPDLDTIIDDIISAESDGKKHVKRRRKTKNREPID